MDHILEKEALAPRGAARRTFLTQAATAGAVLGAAPAMPAFAQIKHEGPAMATKSDQVFIADILASYATHLKYEELPPEVIRTAKRIILDTLGCAIGAYKAGPSQIAIKLASGVTAVNGATVLCNGVKTSLDLAVFANGVMIRYLDFNDGYISLGSGHPSDTLAALLSSAEVAGSSGRDLILATVLAYEVFCKIMDVLDSRRLGLDHSTIIGLAAVVGASRLLGLTQQQMTHAIGITVGGNIALNQGRVGTLSNWKTYASGEACRKAMFSAQLARNGMTGPSQVFEGRDGFFNVVSHKPFTLPKLGGAGEPFGMMHAFTKRFPLGQYSQTVAQAAAEARPFFSDVSEIEQVNIHVSQSAIKVMADSPDKWRPQTHETADHSMPYAAGVVLMYGTIGEQHYEDRFLHDPRLLDLVSRVRCVPSEEADRREKELNLCDLEVILKSGQRKSVRVEYHRGHWKNPMTDGEMEEKFRLLASKHLASERIDKLLQQLWALDGMPKAGALVGMTKV
jgi:2-methylcitrate dehydratase